MRFSCSSVMLSEKMDMWKIWLIMELCIHVVSILELFKAKLIVISLLLP
jgi:hypothetical protein